MERRQSVKALAEQRGRERHSHRNLYEVASRRAGEFLARNLRSDFQAARALRANFCADWQPAEMVGTALQHAQRLVVTPEQRSS